MNPFESVARKSSDEAIMKIAVDPLKKSFEQGGFKRASEKAQEMLNIRIRFDHEKDPNFEQDRERLNSEAGLIISNHPGRADTVAVLGTLERKDVKFIVGNADRLGKIIPADQLLQASKDLGQLRGLMRNVKAHIEQGGVVFLYPEEQQVEGDEGKTFQAGFGHLLKDIPPDAMVYALRVNPEDVERMKGKHHRSAEMLTRLVKTAVLPRTEPDIVHVDERYSTASEWLGAFKESGLPKSEYNRFLSERYRSQFTY